MRASLRAGGRESGGRWLEPTREKVHSDDLKNPEYRKGRHRPVFDAKAAAPRPPSLGEQARRRNSPRKSSAPSSAASTGATASGGGWSGSCSYRGRANVKSAGLARRRRRNSGGA